MAIRGPRAGGDLPPYLCLASRRGQLYGQEKGARESGSAWSFRLSLNVRIYSSMLRYVLLLCWFGGGTAEREAGAGCGGIPGKGWF